jgi:hypothetical protein
MSVEVAVSRILSRSVLAIEILGARLEGACLKKGRIFSAELHPMYIFCEFD